MQPAKEKKRKEKREIKRINEPPSSPLSLPTLPPGALFQQQRGWMKKKEKDQQYRGPDGT